MATSAQKPLKELSALGGDVGSTTVSGIPTLFARNEGPLTGALIFRVGIIDETLTTSGITHLLEHLTLDGPTRTTHTLHNGETRECFTIFHANGTDGEVVAYLNGVCAALSDVPVGRIDVEKDILRAEAAGRLPTSVEWHRGVRYGAQGPGLINQREVGLGRIDGDQVRDWARTRFTRGNAVLYLTSDRVPPGLDLKLPEGPRRAIPVQAEVHPRKPAYFVGAPGGVLIDAIVTRSPAAQLFARVAAKALFRSLRQERGYSYAVDCSYEPIDAERARVTVFADALPERHAEVAAGVFEVLARLRAGEVSEDELTSARTMLNQLEGSPTLGAALLPMVAMNLLWGAENLSQKEYRRRADSLTAADISAVATEFWQDALVQLPDEDLAPAGLERARRHSEEVIKGRGYPVLGDIDAKVVIGADGASMVTSESTSTVRLTECAGYFSMPDGGRTLVGLDGFSVPLEPTLHSGYLADAIADLDARIPPELVIPMPARKPEEIPAIVWNSGETVSSRFFAKGRGRPGFGIWATIVFVILLFVVAVLGVITVGDTLLVYVQSVRGSNDPPPTGLTEKWVTIGLLVAFGVVLLIGLRRRRRWEDHET